MAINLERMLAGYVECADFADCGPDHETHEKEWSGELDARMAKDCATFIAMCDEYKVLDDLAELAPEYSDERFGHDLWLTRNGHGAGYWDRSELEPMIEALGVTLGTRLTQLAERMGGVDLYVGDDGLVYA